MTTLGRQRVRDAVGLATRFSPRSSSAFASSGVLWKGYIEPTFHARCSPAFAQVPSFASPHFLERPMEYRGKGNMGLTLGGYRECAANGYGVFMVWSHIDRRYRNVSHRESFNPLRLSLTFHKLISSFTSINAFLVLKDRNVISFSSCY